MSTPHRKPKGGAIAARYRLAQRRHRDALLRSNTVYDSPQRRDPSETDQARPIFGRLAGQIVIADDFDTLPDDLIAAMESED